MAFSISYVYEILDKYSGPLKRISEQTKNFQQQAEKATKAAQQQAPAMSRMQDAFAALGAGMLLKRAIDDALSLDDAMQNLAKNVPQEQIAGFKDRFREMSIEMGKSAVGLAQIAYEGSKMGIAGKDLDGFTVMVAKVATAFEITDEAAGASIASINAKLGLSVDQVNTLMARVNYLSDNFASNGGRMIEIIQRTSGTFSTLKMPDTLVSSLASFADTLETSPELAASGLNMMFKVMMKNQGTMKKLLADPQKVIQEEFAKFQKMAPAQRTAAIFKKYGDEAGRFVLKAVEQAGELDKMISKAGSADAVGSLDKEFQNRMNRVSTQFAKFQAILTDIFVTIGDALLPVIVPVMQFIGGLIRGFAQSFPLLTKMAGGFLLVGTILAGLSFVAPMFMAIVGAVAALSWPVTAAIAAGIAFAASLESWKASGHPIIAMLSSMGDEVSALWLSIKELFGLSDESSGAFDWVDALGRAFMVPLAAIRVFLQAWQGLIGMISGLVKGDMAAAAASVTGAFDKIKSGVVTTYQQVTAPMGPVSQQAAANPMSGAQTATVSQESAALIAGETAKAIEKAKITADVNVTSAPAASPLPTGANAPTRR